MRRNSRPTAQPVGPNTHRAARLLGLAPVVALVAAAWAFPAAAADEPAEGNRPNIVFVYCDDHAYQAISAYQSITPYGLDLNRTPNIDRLAKEGMRFDNCYVTNSICGPCRAVVQTGKYSHKNGFYCNGDRFDGSQQTFPKLLQKAGYQTAVIGKWHLGTHQVPQGFDYAEVLIGQGPYYNPPMLRNGQRVNHTGYTTDIITDLTLAWLKEKRDPNKPFMLMYQHKAPHRNWQPGPKHLNLYDDRTIPEPDTLFDDYKNRATPAKTQDMTIAETLNPSDLKLVPPRNLTPEQRTKWDAAYGPKNEAFAEANLEGRELVRWKYQRYMKDYLRCIASVDENLGRVLKYLDETGLADNTVVIYTSDQSFYLGEHGWFDKRWIYEESLRTPLLVRWPGEIEPGSTNDQIVSNLDFAETFLDLAGADVPGDMQGASLVPLFRGKRPADWRKCFYYQYYEFPGAHDVRRHYGVCDGRFKLIHFYEPSVDEWELFDLHHDPKELCSVYGVEKYAADQARLKEQLARLQDELEVPRPDPPESYRGGEKRYRKAVERMQEKFEKLQSD
jgi:arylsulfatase A-like enzyme